jgi:hypothetical protein
MQMSAFLLYFASHWTLVIAAILAVVALGLAAYILKNWKIALAAFAVAIAGFLYQGAVISGIKEQAAKDLAVQVEISAGRLRTLQTLTFKDAAKAQADTKSINKLETLASETPPNNAACFDAATSHRMFRLRQRAASSISGTVALPASRISNLLPWRKAKPRQSP